MGKKPTGGTSVNPQRPPETGGGDPLYIAHLSEPYTSYGLPDGTAALSGAPGVIYVPQPHADAVSEQHGLTERDGEPMTADAVAAEQTASAVQPPPEA
jgi:hypothetical protein